MLSDKQKLIALTISIVVVILIGLTGVGLWLFWNAPTEPIITQPQPINTSTTSSLPVSNNTGSGGNGTTAAEQLQKEKQFISSWYQPTTVSYQASAPGDKLPFANIKDEVINYRDFNRKITIDPHLDRLSTDGFVVIDSPFGKESPTNWQSAYSILKDQEVPLYISSDAVLGVYQDTLGVLYKEIEQENFYPSLWNLLNGMASKVQQRYDARRLRFGIENDLVTEANRLELAYLSVALELLKPKEAQVKESFSVDKKFFTPQEASTYNFRVPTYLTDEVAAEVALIEKKTPGASSPLFLYIKNYAELVVPSQYLSSEKLKNYYLTVNWLTETLFPLWHKQNNCPDCVLDEPDHRINFVSALYLSHDLATNQALKNQWANIYKATAFFKGLESNLTYLDYHIALETILGTNYDLDGVLTKDDSSIKKLITDLQQELDGNSYPELLSGPTVALQNKGLRLLRGRNTLHATAFKLLTTPNVDRYQNTVSSQTPAPFTTCQVKNQNNTYTRCNPTALDLFSVLKNSTADTVIRSSNNAAYQNYDQQLNKLRNDISLFDQNTWHDNNYLATLQALQKLEKKEQVFLPAYMKTDAWQNKNLNTSLGAWVNVQRDVILEHTIPQPPIGIESYFGYGYVEPQIALYAELLANVRMIKQGFSSLQIISQANKPYERLSSLEKMLERVIEISKKEIERIELGIADYNFINGFYHEIGDTTGDIAPARLAVNATVTQSYDQNTAIQNKLNGIDFVIVTYPDATGKPFFAIGPVFDYTESKGTKAWSTEWQKVFKVLP